MLQFTTSNLNMELKNIENERKRRDHLILHNYLIRSRETLKSLDVINTSMFSHSSHHKKRLINREKREIGKSSQFWTLCSQNVMEHHLLERECLEKALRNELKELEKQNREKKEKTIACKDIFNKSSVDEKYERSEEKIQKSQEIFAVKEKGSVENYKMNGKSDGSEMENLRFWLKDLHEEKQIKENEEKITKAETKIIQELLCLEKLNLLHKIPIENLQIVNKLLSARNKCKVTEKKNILKKVTNQSDGKVSKIVKKVSIQEEDGSIWETREAKINIATKGKERALLSTFSSEVESEKGKNKKCQSFKGIPNKPKSEAKEDLKEKERKLSQNSEKQRHFPKEEIKHIANKNSSILKKENNKKAIEKEERETESNFSEHSETNKIKKSSSSILLSSNKRKGNNQIENLFYKKDLLAHKQKKETNLSKKTYHSKNGTKENSTEKIKRPSSSKNKGDEAPENNRSKNSHKIHSQTIPSQS